MLIYSNMQTQQNTNNAQRTMKKERSSIQSCPHFFFSLLFVGLHAFVEDKLSAYQTIYQCIMYNIQHFNAFTPVNKSVGKRQGIPSGITYADMPSCRQTGMATYRHGGMTCHPKLAKEERLPATTDSTADFLKRKSHSSLGRFLHAPLR